MMLIVVRYDMLNVCICLYITSICGIGYLEAVHNVHACNDKLTPQENFHHIKN